MIKRLLKKAWEQVVKQYEYYRVAIQQETEERAREQARFSRQQQLQAMAPHQPKSPHTPRLTQQFNYPPPTSSHVPHPPYGRSSFESPHPHEPNDLHHPHPSSSSAMFPLRQHSATNLQGSGHHGNTATPNRTHSYNNLPSNGHMTSKQLHFKPHPSTGNKFTDIFESNDSHLHDLEETFV